ncbi:MAG: hypothetical protein IT487_20085 [Chromatiaceae bacterium]|nr:hypothetical protein [Chromatiaceae bacterium]
MLYLTGNLNALVRPLLDSGGLGLMTTPRNRYRIMPGWTWAADNGCFSRGYPGDAPWLAWLESFPVELRTHCLFATAPDIVGDAIASLDRSRPWLPVIRSLGYRAALVTQDGLTPGMVPWADVDWLFIGGTNQHKLGPEAEALIEAAKFQGIPVHVGRVNSGRRYATFAALGCTSADGTFLGFGPTANLPRLQSWIDKHRQQQALDFSYA